MRDAVARGLRPRPEGLARSISRHRPRQCSVGQPYRGGCVRRALAGARSSSNCSPGQPTRHDSWRRGARTAPNHLEPAGFGPLGSRAEQTDEEGRAIRVGSAGCPARSSYGSQREHPPEDTVTWMRADPRKGGDSADAAVRALGTSGDSLTTNASGNGRRRPCSARRCAASLATPGLRVAYRAADCNRAYRSPVGPRFGPAVDRASNARFFGWATGLRPSADVSNARRTVRRRKRPEWSFDGLAEDGLHVPADESCAWCTSVDRARSVLSDTRSHRRPRSIWLVCGNPGAGPNSSRGAREMGTCIIARR